MIWHVLRIGIYLCMAFLPIYIQGEIFYTIKTLKTVLCAFTWLKQATTRFLVRMRNVNQITSETLRYVYVYKN